MELIKNLKWRYATKKFDPSKKISNEDLAKIKEAVQLSVSSYGLQLYKILIVEDSALREQLKPASWGQTQITDASHLFVFCSYASVKNEDIDEYINLKASTQGIAPGALTGYGDFMKSKLAEQTDSEKAHWTAKQTYLALGNLLAACAELNIDACPMEGFDAAQYDEILGLSQKGLSASVVATIGYRAEDDQTQNALKVRKPLELLFEVK